MPDSVLSGSVLFDYFLSDSVLAGFVSFDHDHFGTGLENHSHHLQTEPVLFDSVVFGFVLSDSAPSHSVLFDYFLSDSSLLGFVLSDFVPFGSDQFGSWCYPVLEHRNLCQQTDSVLLDSVFFGFDLSDSALSHSVLFDYFLSDSALVGFVLSGCVSSDSDWFGSCCYPVLDLEHHTHHLQTDSVLVGFLTDFLVLVLGLHFAQTGQSFLQADLTVYFQTVNYFLDFFGCCLV